MQARWAAAELAAAGPMAAPFSVVGEAQGRLPLKPAASAPVQLPAVAAAAATAAPAKRVLGGGIAQVPAYTPTFAIYGPVFCGMDI